MGHRPAWLSHELFPFYSHYFSFRGSNLHYLDEGEGIPIVFSHPAVGWSFMYRSLIKELKKNFRCIAIDYPGFGLSEKPENYTYSLQSQSEALEALVDHLKLGKVILLGHDTGGASAFAFGLRRSEHLLGLILTDTVIFPVNEYPFIQDFLNIMGYRLFRWVNRQFNLLVQVTSRLAFKTIKLTRAERRGYLKSFDTREKRDAVLMILLDLKNDPELMEQIHRAFQEQWQHIPTLLMCGEKDKLVSGGVYDRIRELLPQGAAHLIPGEEHFPHEGQAELMAQYIRAWSAEYLAINRIQNVS